MDCCFSLTFLLLTIVFPFSNTTAQTSTTFNQSDSFINVKVYFQDETREDAHLYTGKEYIKYAASIKGHPFFDTDQMQKGEIFYNGTLYENVPLLFDIVSQEIVIKRYNQDERMKLLNEKVKYFILNGHRFENIFLAEGKDENISNTIYDIAFDGKASVLIKRVKHIKNGLKAEDPTSFVEEDEFYIRNGKSLYAVANKSSVMQAFNDKKESIKTFIRKNKFRFKKNIEKELIMTATYYSILN